MRRWLATFGLGICAIAGHISSEILYEGFEGKSSRWQVLTAGEYDTTYQGSGLDVSFPDNTLGIIADTAVYDSFTYTVSVNPKRSSFADIGIGFCLQEDLDGYFFLIDSTELFKVFKYTPSSPVPVFLAHFPASSIDHSTENTLVVSKRGNQFRFFCNGVFLDSLTDESFDTGMLGLAFAGPVDMEYRNLVITDEWKSVPDPSCYKAIFDSDWEESWYRGFADPETEIAPQPSGALRIRTESTAFTSPLITTGNYGGYSVQGVFQPVESNTEGFDSSAYFGIGFIDFIQEPNFAFSSRSYVFWVNSDSTVSVIRPDTADLDSQIITAEITGSLHHGAHPDTLEVIWDDSSFIFSANGFRLAAPMISSEKFEIDAIGIIADKGVSMDVHSFSAAPSKDPACPLSQPIRPLAVNDFVVDTWQKVEMHDLLGRSIPGGNRLQTLPARILLLRNRQTGRARKVIDIVPAN